MTALFQNNELESALEMAQAVLESYIRSKGNSDSFSIMARNNLGMVQLALGRFEEAAGIFRDGYELGREVLGPSSEIRIKCTANLADALLELGLAEEAEEICFEVLELRRDLSPPRPIEVAHRPPQPSRGHVWRRP